MSHTSHISCLSTADKSLLRHLLCRSPYDASYLLGDLQEPFFSHCRWFVATFRGDPRAVVLLYEGLSTPTILSHGAPDLIAAILSQFASSLPQEGFAKIPHAHEQAFLQHCSLYDHDHMWCMGLSASSFQAMAGPDASRQHDVRMLTSDDSLDDIFAVYRDYPENFFEPQQLDTGLYYGSFVDGKLCCIVGTHVYAPEERVAVLGNIVTAHAYRGQGHARACCAALIQELLMRGCTHISLHVSDQNTAAIGCYRSLGFVFQSTLIDVPYRDMH